MVSIKQKKAFKKSVENHGNISKAMKEAGYTDATAKNPSNLTSSKAWKELMEEYLPERELALAHKQLLNSTKMDHMVFPLGPADEDDINFSGAKVSRDDELESEDNEFTERTTLTDKEIIEMLAEVNCKVRRIVHGESARHVYFWAYDSKARKDAIDMGYKLRGSYEPDKLHVEGNISLSEMFGKTKKANG